MAKNNFSQILKSKKIVIAYSVIVAAVIISNLIGIVFSYDIFNYLIAGIVVFYPIMVFIFGQKIKLKINYLKLSLVTAAFLFLSALLSWPVIMIFGFFHVETKQTEIKIDNYKVIETSRLGWAGPATYSYILKRAIVFNLFEQEIAHSNPSANIDSCMVDLVKLRSNLIYRFDRCKLKIEKIK